MLLQPQRLSERTLDRSDAIVRHSSKEEITEKCVWCDTPYTWNWVGTKFIHPDKFDPRKESHKMTAEQVFQKIQWISHSVKAVVISGGEPMLQQKQLIEFLQILRKNDYWVEVETNATIVPTDEFIGLVNQFNCSPKLSNSGPDNPLELRDKPDAMKVFASLYIATFKFVIATDEDLKEVWGLVNKYHLHRVYLMPEGKTKEEQLARQDRIRELCDGFGFGFSPRLQVLEHGNQRGT